MASAEQKAIVRERQRQRARERAQAKKEARLNGFVEGGETHTEDGTPLIAIAPSPVEQLPLFDRMVHEIHGFRLLKERRVFIFTLTEDDKIILKQFIASAEGEEFPSIKDVVKAITAQDRGSGRYAVMWNHPKNVTSLPEINDDDRDFAKKLDDASKLLELSPALYGVFARGGQFQIQANV